MRVREQPEGNESVTFETITLCVRFSMTAPSALPKQSSIGRDGSSSCDNRLPAGHRRIHLVHARRLGAKSQQHDTRLVAHETVFIQESPFDLVRLKENARNPVNNVDRADGRRFVQTYYVWLQLLGRGP